MDKHQAEAIAKAILAHDEAENDKRQRTAGRDKYSKLARLLLMISVIFVAISAGGTHHFFFGDSVKGSTFLTIVEAAVAVGAFAGFLFISWWRFLAARARTRNNEAHLQQELAAYK